MPTNYSKLFLLMRKKKVTQKELIEGCNISPSTFIKMKKGENISLDILDKICAYLNCDYSDVITRKNSNNIYSYDIANKLNAINCAINEYMILKNLSLTQFSKLCGISYNTLLSIRNGYIPTKNTILKLFNIEKDFQKILIDNLSEK